MRHFKKTQAPESFTKWAKKNPNKSWEDFGKEAICVKDTLKDSLLKEQGYLCCYCECRVDKLDSHIEHFIPRGKDNNKRFDYNNLHISCTKQGKEKRCGHKKDNEFNEDLISPLEEDCSSHFSYKTSGEIEGIDKRGKETREICNLHSKALTERRKALIDVFLSYNDDDLRKEEVKKHLDFSKTELGEFYSMIEFFHKKGYI